MKPIKELLLPMSDVDQNMVVEQGALRDLHDSGAEASGTTGCKVCPQGKGCMGGTRWGLRPSLESTGGSQFSPILGATDR